MKYKSTVLAFALAGVLLLSGTAASQAGLVITYSPLSDTQTLVEMQGHVDLGVDWKDIPVASFSSGTPIANLNENMLRIAQPSTSIYYPNLSSGVGILSQDPWTGYTGSELGSGPSGIGGLFFAGNSAYIYSATEWGSIVTADNGGRITWNAQATYNEPLSTFNTGDLVLSYPGDLSLTIARTSTSSAVPEPGTWAAAALLVSGAAFARWRRRQRTAG